VRSPTTGSSGWTATAERLLFEMLVIVVASFAVVTALVRLRFSPVTGYLLAGVLIGPHGLGLLPASEGVWFLGELGVVLLMFIIGLEFSLPRMLTARSLVFGMGSTQVALTTMAGGLLAWLAGLGWAGSILIGGAVAMSSTAIAAKQLSDQEELNTQHGGLGHHQPDVQRHLQRCQRHPQHRARLRSGVMTARR
jgi:CPA2 family monovalent cation:H+ antiporter-2